MQQLLDTEISRAITAAFHEKLVDRFVGDVLIAGSGPAGLTCAYYLARRGIKTTVIERRLAPGGGIWGGGMAMNEVVVRGDALPLLRELAIGYSATENGLYTVNSIELACGLCSGAVRAGAQLFNLMTVEDLCLHRRRVAGAVVNRSLIGESLPVDPLTFSARAVIDATGHEAALVELLRRRKLLPEDNGRPLRGEAPMDAEAGEEFVVSEVGEVYPGLWVAGMSVCATFYGPRMGPVFGGMLLSGKRAAELAASSLSEIL